MKQLHCLIIALLCCFFIAVLSCGSALAGDWKVLEEKTIKAVDQGISFENDNLGRLKKLKLSIEGADVKIHEITIDYRARKDDKITGLAPLKDGGQITPIDLPGHRARLRSVTVECELLGGAESAKMTLWGIW